MKVVILMENSTCRDAVACAHGLSMYIETDKHKILFDMGPDAQFIDNAKALSVDLTQVDIAFLSHAHNDHCGGLEAFLKLNDRAKVYMQTWVKVKENWRDSDVSLNNFGFNPKEI